MKVQCREGKGNEIAEQDGVMQTVKNLLSLSKKVDWYLILLKNSLLS